MTDILPVSSDWLALRESEDARARSLDLARTAASLLAGRPGDIHDLGSGTGSMMRWLAPLLPGPQTWILHDWNQALTDRALEGARPLDADGQPVSVSARTGNLENLEAPDLTGAGLVTASALLDVLTFTETHAIVQACLAAGSPAFVSLSVTGKVDLSPHDESDTSFETAFNLHQERDSGGRWLLGPNAGSVVRHLFEDAGWNVREVDTVWRLGSHDPRLLAEWFGGWVDAAVEQRPELRGEALAYRELRMTQASRGALSVAVHHTDLLAWPR
ncbi:MAG: SAM-dependent methyltransferase [Frondihabitans sp.]|nr:SAM-dependent methyltransferase [Frondihabitans sp.]